MVIGKLLGRCNVPALADPDLKISGMGRSKKVFFRHFGPQFGLKIRGADPLGLSPGSDSHL